MTDHYPDPEADGAARAAQIAAVTIALAEAIARVRQERAAQQAADDQHVAAVARANRYATHAAARIAWTPALDERWLRRADLPAVLGAWAPAVGWANTDPARAQVRRIGANLNQAARVLNVEGVAPLWLERACSIVERSVMQVDAATTEVRRLARREQRVTPP